MPSPVRDELNALIHLSLIGLKTQGQFSVGGNKLLTVSHGTSRIGDMRRCGPRRPPSKAYTGNEPEQYQESA